jgi:hypothetical protein
MTAPFPPPSEDDKLKRHLEKGGRVSLESKQTFNAAPAALVGSAPTVIYFPGTQRLPDKMQADTKVRLNLTLMHTQTPDFVVLAFLNAPNANAATALSSPGFVGPIGFFGDASGGNHHGDTVARLSAGPVVKRIGGADPITLTLVPIAFPGRDMRAQTVQVKASLELLVSKVEKLR